MSDSQIYQCHKQVKATPMTRQKYNDYRGWELPSDENGADEGFLVEYLDGGESNHPEHQGYISWSPKAVFERGYTPNSNENLSFGKAIESMEAGKRVSRAGWNGKGMWLRLVPECDYDVLRKCVFTGDEYHGDEVSLASWIGMKTADNKFIPWLASQSDMLAKDWCVVSG
jgi:hypothetical protein